MYNGKEIGEDVLADLLEDIKKTLGDNPATLYEILTCAYLKFCEEFKNNITLCVKLHHCLRKQRSIRILSMPVLVPARD